MAISLGADPRTRTTTLAGGAVLLMLSALALNRPDSNPAPPTPEAIVAECRQLYGELNPTFRGLPAQRFEVTKGDELLRVYVSDVDDWINVCRSGPTGVDAAAGTRMSDGPDDQLRLFDSSASMLRANLLLGHVPAGATTIEARLTTGQVVTGDHDGDVFAIWSPDAPVAGAQVTATGPAGTTLTATAP
ncbi:hypothetical protein [Actinoplanes couchii]|uniref:Secreted protein n=1 Tax=Actinoplanes couchii TaxID=403638 RepID=A0ABQ3X264_9ACTN|nr:hypothetical protein [Actinoplanes couchii]MDR6317004.1 hypothetical protein [Actinoplanes couchii]GID52612.1 hypothetical protein Aco03nite_010160 [Actinoplanes couchii]